MTSALKNWSLPTLYIQVQSFAKAWLRSFLMTSLWTCDSRLNTANPSLRASVICWAWSEAGQLLLLPSPMSFITLIIETSILLTQVCIFWRWVSTIWGPFRIHSQMISLVLGTAKLGTFTDQGYLSALSSSALSLGQCHRQELKMLANASFMQSPILSPVSQKLHIMDGIMKSMCIIRFTIRVGHFNCMISPLDELSLSEPALFWLHPGLAASCPHALESSRLHIGLRP